MIDQKDIEALDDLRTFTVIACEALRTLGQEAQATKLCLVAGYVTGLVNRLAKENQENNPLSNFKNKAGQ